MVAATGRRTVMTLYSGNSCPYSHRVRIVLKEKNATVEIVGSEGNHLPEGIMELNPYNSFPTLVDRELVLYHSPVIMEYLDERFPHPSLMPVDPIGRAQTRLLLYRIERDWYGLVSDLTGKDAARADKARRILRDELTAVSPIFDQKPYFMSDELSLVDCSLAPLLWRLPVYGVELPSPARALLKYADRIFSRAAFRASLSEAERTMRT